MKQKNRHVEFRNDVYRLSSLGAEALSELLRSGVDRNTALLFVLRQEGYPV